MASSDLMHALHSNNHLYNNIQQSDISEHLQHREEHYLSSAERHLQAQRLNLLPDIAQTPGGIRHQRCLQP